MSKEEKFVFRKSAEDKKLKKVFLEKGERISKGGFFSPFGIHKAKVGKAEVPVVLKEYAPEQSYKLERISEVYKSMRANRLRVPATFRFDAKRGVSIMSDLNRFGHIALSSRNPSDNLEFNSIESFPDFQSVARDLFEEALRASQLGYYIPSDSYFLLVSQRPKVQSSFVIGDLDTVSRSEDSAPQKPGYALFEAYSFLSRFIKNWVKPETASSLNEITEIEYQIIQEKAVQMGLMESIWDPIEVR